MAIDVNDPAVAPTATTDPTSRPAVAAAAEPGAARLRIEGLTKTYRVFQKRDGLVGAVDGATGAERWRQSVAGGEAVLMIVLIGLDRLDETGCDAVGDEAHGCRTVRIGTTPVGSHRAALQSPSAASFTERSAMLARSRAARARGSRVSRRSDTPVRPA